MTVNEPQFVSKVSEYFLPAASGSVGAVWPPSSFASGVATLLQPGALGPVCVWRGGRGRRGVVAAVAAAAGENERKQGKEKDGRPHEPEPMRRPRARA